MKFLRSKSARREDPPPEPVPHPETVQFFLSTLALLLHQTYFTEEDRHFPKRLLERLELLIRDRIRYTRVTEVAQSRNAEAQGMLEALRERLEYWQKGGSDNPLAKAAKRRAAGSRPVPYAQRLEYEPLELRGDWTDGNA